MIGPWLSYEVRFSGGHESLPRSGMRFVRALRKFLSGFVLGCGGTLWLFSRGGRKYPHGNIKLHWTVHHGNIKAFFLENINSNWMLSNVKRVFFCAKGD